MRTVLILGDSPVPPPLRDLIQRGSTSFVEMKAADLVGGRAAPAFEVDRVVFWTASDDADLAQVADRYARQEAAARREMVVFVAAERGGAPPPPRLSPNETFLWPRDEDRLKMAFLTGA